MAAGNALWLRALLVLIALAGTGLETKADGYITTYTSEDRWLSWGHHAFSALEHERFPQAIRFLSAALDNNPKPHIAAYLYGLRGEAYIELGKLADARADYARVLAVPPKDADGYVIRANVHSAGGNYQATVQDLRKATQLSPQNPFALNGLAWVQSTCPQALMRNGPEAVRNALVACKLTRWQRGGIIDTLAAASAETGDFAQAIKYQNRAVKMSHDLPFSRERMKERLELYRQGKPYRERPRLTLQ